ncbi:MAG: ABC transporter ATP-binding protein [Ilumatobacter sp.]
MSSLELHAVSVSYSDRVALAPFSNTAAAGEWIGLIGPNGAGKSSLLRSIAGLVPHAGTIRVGGDLLDELSDRQRAQRVAYVPQEPLIPDDMTVTDYVLLGRTPYIGYWATESKHDRQVVADTLDLLRLGDFAERRLGALSGGERQRVVLARALAQQAPILLLDEPTSALDIGHQQQALELVTELRRSQSLTVVSALHDLTLAGTYTDRLVMLHEGEVVASGPAAEVLTAQRLGAVYNVCVTVDVDPEDGTVIVVPRRGFPVP